MQSVEDLEHLLQLPSLSVLDVQSNKINDPKALDILSQMPNLKVLYFQGNEAVKEIKQYRKTVIYRCKTLRYLDDRPIFDDERRRVNAWGAVMEETNGDIKAAQQAERDEINKIKDEKKAKEEANFLAFEKMMREGKAERERREQELRDQGELPPAPVQINQFSGEKIIPIKDCDMVRNAREERWKKVVDTDIKDINSATGTKYNTSSSATPANKDIFDMSDIQGTVNEEADTTSATHRVDTERLKVIHQCATVGTGSVTGNDKFVANHFVNESAHTMPPPPPSFVEAKSSDSHADIVTLTATQSKQEVTSSVTEPPAPPLMELRSTRSLVSQSDPQHESDVSTSKVLIEEVPSTSTIPSSEELNESSQDQMNLTSIPPPAPVSSTSSDNA